MNKGGKQNFKNHYYHDCITVTKDHSFKITIIHCEDGNVLKVSVCHVFLTPQTSFLSHDTHSNTVTQDLISHSDLSHVSSFHPSLYMVEW